MMVNITRNLDPGLLALASRYWDCGERGRSSRALCYKTVITFLCVKKHTKVMSRLDRNVVLIIAKCLWETRRDIAWVNTNTRIRSKELQERKQVLTMHKDQRRQFQNQMKQRRSKPR
jgi:hypothetical protein